MPEESMRTTVVLKDDLVRKAKKLSPETTLSGLLNICLADWIANHSRKELKTRLVAEYRAARQESRRISREFASLDTEGWPSW
jgi:hypothetical protein